MTELYIAFKGVTQGPCLGFYGTKATADAYAAEHPGSVVHPEPVVVPDYLPPRHAYFDGTNVVELAEEHYRAGLTATQRLQEDFRRLHDFLISTVSEISPVPPKRSKITGPYPSVTRDAAHDILALAHRASRGIGLSASWTTDEKMAWVAGMLLGPTDVSLTGKREDAALRLLQAVEVARRGGSPIVVPANYAMWTDPEDGSRVALAGMSALVTLRSGNFAAAPPGGGVDAAGTWISGMTA